MFLDFDGTLVDIAAPSRSRIRSRRRSPSRLACLRDRLGGALAIISGRRIEALDRFLAPYEFDAAGVHGLERRSGGQLQLCPVRESGRLRAVLTSSQRAFAAKRWVSTSKTRAAPWPCTGARSPQLEGLVLEAMEDVMEGLGPEYMLQKGKAVAEILSADVNKGLAIEASARRAALPGTAADFHRRRPDRRARLRCGQPARRRQRARGARADLRAISPRRSAGGSRPPPRLGRADSPSIPNRTFSHEFSRPRRHRQLRDIGAHRPQGRSRVVLLSAPRWRAGVLRSAGWPGRGRHRARPARRRLFHSAQRHGAVRAAVTSRTPPSW